MCRLTFMNTVYKPSGAPFNIRSGPCNKSKSYSTKSDFMMDKH